VYRFYVPGSVWVDSEETRVTAKAEVKAALPLNILTDLY